MSNIMKSAKEMREIAENAEAIKNVMNTINSYAKNGITEMEINSRDMNTKTWKHIHKTLTPLGYRCSQFSREESADGNSRPYIIYYYSINWGK